MDLKTEIDIPILQNMACRRVLDVSGLVHRLDLGVDDAVLVHEKGGQAAQADIAIFVDRETEHRPAVLFVPLRIIRAAPEQRDAERCAAYYHSSVPDALSGRAITEAARARLSGVPISTNAPCVA